jgi:hypothetical protein
MKPREGTILSFVNCNGTGQNVSFFGYLNLDVLFGEPYLESLYGGIHDLFGSSDGVGGDATDYNMLYMIGSDMTFSDFVFDGRRSKPVAHFDIDSNARRIGHHANEEMDLKTRRFVKVSGPVLENESKGDVKYEKRSGKKNIEEVVQYVEEKMKNIKRPQHPSPFTEERPSSSSSSSSFRDSSFSSHQHQPSLSSSHLPRRLSGLPSSYSLSSAFTPSVILLDVSTLKLLSSKFMESNGGCISMVGGSLVWQFLIKNYYLNFFFFFFFFSFIH